MQTARYAMSVMIAILAAVPADFAQHRAATDVYTPQLLKERAVALRLKAEASASGVASETLEEYPQHITMLAYRSKSGSAEVHAKFADVFVIEEGSVTLETGGTVVGPSETGPGETRGSALEGGHSQQLHAGDIVHIPAGVPHLMRLDAGTSVLYFVVKAQEKP